MQNVNEWLYKFSDSYESGGFKGAMWERDHEVGQMGTKCLRE